MKVFIIRLIIYVLILPIVMTGVNYYYPELRQQFIDRSLLEPIFALSASLVFTLFGIQSYRESIEIRNSKKYPINKEQLFEAQLV